MNTGHDVSVDRLAVAAVLVAGLGTCCGEAAAAPGPPLATLRDTGPPQSAWYDPDGACSFSATLLGWSSGQLCSPDGADDDFPQRRTAQAFDLPPASCWPSVRGATDDRDDLYNCSFHVVGGPPRLGDGDGEAGVTDFLGILSHRGPCAQLRWVLSPPAASTRRRGRSRRPGRAPPRSSRARG